MKALAACLMPLSLCAAPPSTYEQDRAKERVKYAEDETVTAKEENRTIFFVANGKSKARLVVVSYGGPWNTEVVDSYLHNEGRMKEMRELGFKEMAFVEVTGEGKKRKTTVYAAFEFKRR